jgi:ribosome production factor 1
MKRIVKQAIERDYTDIILVNEDNKVPSTFLLIACSFKLHIDAITICHLPDGPTAYFKINSLKFTKDLKRKGESSDHFPEIILNNFNTRLGHTIARMFACLFPHNPEFKGRRVITLHNQRDYIFFRHHRYVPLVRLFGKHLYFQIRIQARRQKGGTIGVGTTLCITSQMVAKGNV